VSETAECCAIRRDDYDDKLDAASAVSESGGQYPGGEYEGKQDATGMMPIRRMAGKTQPARTTASKMWRVRCRVRRDG